MLSSNCPWTIHLSRTIRLISGEIQKQLGLQVLGFFPKIKGIKLESRHLGLKMPKEIEGLREQVELAAEVVNNNIDV